METKNIIIWKDFKANSGLLNQSIVKEEIIEKTKKQRLMKTRSTLLTFGLLIMLGFLPGITFGQCIPAIYSSLNNSVLTAYGDSVNSIGPYTYLWSNGDTSQVISPQGSGNYCVTVTGANQCSGNSCFNFNSLCTGFSTNITKSGDTLSANISQGVAPYTYQWSNGSSDALIVSSSSVGSAVKVTVTDVNGCSATDSYYVSTNNCSNFTLSIKLSANKDFLAKHLHQLISH
jgi:hypothetical protein